MGNQLHCLHKIKSWTPVRSKVLTERRGRHSRSFQCNCLRVDTPLWRTHHRAYLFFLEFEVPRSLFEKYIYKTIMVCSSVAHWDMVDRPKKSVFRYNLWFCGRAYCVCAISICLTTCNTREKHAPTTPIIPVHAGCGVCADVWNSAIRRASASWSPSSEPRADASAVGAQCCRCTRAADMICACTSYSDRLHRAGCDSWSTAGWTAVSTPVQ